MRIIALSEESRVIRVEDPTGVFAAVITKRVLEENTRSLQPGGVLLLREVRATLRCTYAI